MALLCWVLSASAGADTCPASIRCAHVLPPLACHSIPTAVALMEAMALTKTIFGGQPSKPDHENVPTAVFSHPQIATVGMSEEQVGARVLHFSRLAARSCAVFSHFRIVAVGMSEVQVLRAS